MLGHLKSGDERVNQIVGDILGLRRPALYEIQPNSVSPRIETDPMRAQRICDVGPCPYAVKIRSGGHGNFPACISHPKPGHTVSGRCWRIGALIEPRCYKFPQKYE